MAFRSEKDLVEVSADHLIVNGEFMKLPNPFPILGKVEWGSGHASLIADYYRCLATGDTFPVDFYEARHAIDLILGMYASKGADINI